MIAVHDVEGNTSHIALVHRTNHLGHHGEAHFLGKGNHCSLVLAHEFGHHGYAGTLEQLAHHIGFYITVLLDLADDFTNAWNINAKKFDFRCGRLWSLHDLCQGCGQCHLIAEVDMSLAQEFGHLWSCGVQTGKNGENRFLAFQNLLMQHVVSLVELYQAGSTEDDKDGINVLETVFAEVDGNAKMLGCTRGEDVDGVGHRRAGEEQALQFFGFRTFDFGHIQSTLRQGIGQHHTRTAGMGNNGKVLAGQRRQGEDTAYGGQLLTREAAHDTRLAEQSLNSRVAAGNGSCMR